MLLFSRTRIAQSFERACAADILATVQEGAALQTVMNAGVGELRPSAGGTTEVFSGVAWTPRRNISIGTKLAHVTVTDPAVPSVLSDLVTDYTDVAVINVADNTALTVVNSGSPTSSQVKVDTVSTPAGNRTRLTFNAAADEMTFSVAYRYTVTPAEAARWGQVFGDQAHISTGTLSVICQGEICTDSYDAASNWYASGTPANVKMVAGGLFARSDSAKAGTIVPMAEIVQAPTADFPFLSLYLHG